MNLFKGDILIVNLDPTIGSEQGKIRPALLIQNNTLNKFSPLVIIAPITSKVYSKKYPTNVFISKKNSKLKEDSTILLNQIRTIDKKRIIKKVGKIEDILLREVDSAIKITLDIN
jgi:mRNA interferase MazF